MKFLVRTQGSDHVDVPPFAVIDIDEGEAIILLQAMDETVRLSPGFPSCSLSFHDMSCTWLHQLEQELIDEIDGACDPVAIDEYETIPVQEVAVQFGEAVVDKGGVFWTAYPDQDDFLMSTKHIPRKLLERVRDGWTKE